MNIVCFGFGQVAKNFIKKNLKENQNLVGVFNPYVNKEKIENLSKKNINFFSTNCGAKSKTSLKFIVPK